MYDVSSWLRGFDAFLHARKCIFSPTFSQGNNRRSTEYHQAHGVFDNLSYFGNGYESSRLS
jgi:hypothetical protein